MILASVALLAGVGAAATPVVGGPPAAPPTGSLLDQGVPHPDLPCVPTVRACVDLAQSRAWLVDRGHVVRGPVDIRGGDSEDPTPRGNFTVQWKAQEYTSREFLVQMPWSVFFADGGIAFHQGNPDTPSAGCVKLDMDDAQAFFEYLQVGDPVQVV